jgi:hypothetical protein
MPRTAKSAPELAARIDPDRAGRVHRRANQQDEASERRQLCQNDGAGCNGEGAENQRVTAIRQQAAPDDGREEP